MKTANSIDLILLNKFQQVSDWLQDFFGFDNFKTAKLLRLAMIISFITRESLSLLNGMDASEIIVIVCSVTIIIKMEIILRRGQQSVKKNPAFMNPVVSEFAITRLMMQFIGAAALVLLAKNFYNIINSSVSLSEQYDQWKEFFWDLFGVLILFVAYFSSCTPKPYKPGKLKNFIEKMSNRVRQSAAPIPKLRLA